MSRRKQHSGRPRHPEVKRVGRILRFVLGAVLLWMVVPFFGGASAGGLGRVLLLGLLVLLV